MLGHRKSCSLFIVSLFQWDFSQSLQIEGDFESCNAMDSAISICAASLDNFNSLQPPEQASCLCGPTLSASSWSSAIPWGPSSFDNLLVNCYLYDATAAPASASSLLSLQGFCADNYATLQSTAATSGVSISTPSSYVTSSRSTKISITTPGNPSSTTSTAIPSSLVTPILTSLAPSPAQAKVTVALNSASPTPSGGKKDDVQHGGILAAAVIGGVCGLGILIVGCLFVCLRRRGPKGRGDFRPVMVQEYGQSEIGYIGLLDRQENPVQL